MLNDKKQIIDTTEFINKRRKLKDISFYEKSKKRLFRLSIFLCLVIIGAIYFTSDVSNIYRIVVEGNVYLKDEDIIELSGLSTDDKYLLTIRTSVASKIKSNGLIESCSVELLDNNLVRINVLEKKVIAYAYEDDNNVLILEDDSRFILDKSSLYLIEKVPLVEGFTKEDIILIEKELVDVDYKMINEISEIHYFPALKYQNVELIMRDGNYVFTSVYGLNILNKYYDIDSSVSTDRNNCYYFEDISGNAYMSACPWEKVEEEVVQEEETVEESE